MSSATVPRPVHEGAVKEYQRRLQLAEENIKGLKEHIDSRQRAKDVKAKATENFRHMAVVELQKRDQKIRQDFLTIRERDRKIQRLRVIQEALFSIVHTNDAKIEKLEREARKRDSTIDCLESKLLKGDENEQSPDSEDESEDTF